MIHGHGDDIYSTEHKIVSNFSSNVYNGLDTASLRSHLSSRLETIHSYPEPDAGSFKTLLADKHNVSTDHICVTNGATEAIYLLAQLFSDSNSAILEPTFSEYADACTVYGHQLTRCLSLNDIPDSVDVLWLCNPNNPTGKIIDLDCLIRYIKTHLNQYIIVDQSYEYFSTKPLFQVTESLKFDRLILLHSLTKQYAIPGLRLGYVTASKDIIAKVNRYRMPWSVNQLAIEAGKYLLNHSGIGVDLESYYKEVRRFKEMLHSIRGLKVYPSDMHYFLCELEFGRASELKSYLIQEYGILIRDASNFYGLGEGYFRLATQSPNENDKLIKAIQTWM